MVRLQVPYRGGEGLRNLIGEWHIRVIWNPRRILAREGREFRLQKQVPSGQPRVQARNHARSYAGFVVVLGLTGGIDAAKSLSNRCRHEGLGFGLLPRCPIENLGTALFRGRGDTVVHVFGS